MLASHLHFDHCGGFTSTSRRRPVRPKFPRAQYVVRRGEWEDATHPHERNRASYLADNFVPLAEAGVLQLVDDDQTIMPGVRVQRTGGHCMHHQMVSSSRAARPPCSSADLIPTTAHLPNPWIMGYDLYPDGHARREESVPRGRRARRTCSCSSNTIPDVAAGYIREERRETRTAA